MTEVTQNISLSLRARGLGVDMGKRGKRITPEVRAAILAYVEQGMTDKDIIQLLGLGAHALRNLKKNEKFRNEYGLAQLRIKHDCIETIRGLALQSRCESVRLKAATWLLERKYPAEYAQHTVINTPNDRAPLDMVLGMNDESEEDLENGAVECTPDL